MTRTLKILLPVLAIFSIVLAGCLTSEREEYRLILNTDGKSGTLIFTKYNIQSTATDSAGQAKDFQELIRNWKSDQYLLEQMDRGAYVKERDMHLEHGKVSWREVSIFSDVTRLIPSLDPRDTVRLSFDTKNGEIEETNGEVSKFRDSVTIMWPPHTHEFNITMARKEFTPKSNFEDRFEAYIQRLDER